MFKKYKIYKNDDNESSNSSNNGNLNKKENKNIKLRKIKIDKKLNKKKKENENKFNFNIFYKIIYLFINIVGFVEATTKTYNFIEEIYKKVCNKMVGTFNKIKSNFLIKIICIKKEINKPNSNSIVKYNFLENKKENNKTIFTNLNQFKLKICEMNVLQINSNFKTLKNSENFKVEFIDKSSNKNFDTDINKTKRIAKNLHRLIKTYNMRKMNNIVDNKLEKTNTEKMKKVKNVEKIIESKNKKIKNDINMIEYGNYYINFKIQKKQNLSKEKQQILNDKFNSFWNSNDNINVSNNNDIKSTDVIEEKTHKLTYIEQLNTREKNKNMEMVIQR